jgi:hypothetical protein
VPGVTHHWVWRATCVRWSAQAGDLHGQQLATRA